VIVIAAAGATQSNVAAAAARAVRSTGRSMPDASDVTGRAMAGGPRRDLREAGGEMRYVPTI